MHDWSPQNIANKSVKHVGSSWMSQDQGQDMGAQTPTVSVFGFKFKLMFMAGQRTPP